MLTLVASTEEQECGHLVGDLGVHVGQNVIIKMFQFYRADVIDMS